MGRLVREHGDAARQYRLLVADIEGIADQLQKLAGCLREDKIEALRVINEHALGFGLAAVMALGATFAAADSVGSVTGLPLPRYASLKTDRVNLREGPSKDHATKWVYQRAGLPVEITAEFDI